MTDRPYRWNEPGIQTVHAVLCTQYMTDVTQYAETIIDALKAAGWVYKPEVTKEDRTSGSQDPDQMGMK